MRTFQWSASDGEYGLRADLRGQQRNERRNLRLMDYLKDDLPKLTLEQAKFKQSLGLNEWQPLPEGVEYPESIR